MTHAPVVKEWSVVVKSERYVTVMAMCVCGDDDCFFTANVYAKDIVHNTPADR